jgi:hypothetical protein
MCSTVAKLGRRVANMKVQRNGTMRPNFPELRSEQRYEMIRAVGPSFLFTPDAEFGVADPILI